MPGSGKSTFGKVLAGRLSYPFVDLDDLIENNQGQLIREIFREKGETFFREVEAHTLRTATTAENNFVMACGGGTPCFHDNMDFINQNGVSIYLKVPESLLVQRLSQTSETDVRPLVQTNQHSVASFVSELLDKRKDFYERAHFRLEETTDYEQLIEQLITPQTDE